jgi:3-oxoacyl-[acyl-carrier protein] reductase
MNKRVVIVGASQGIGAALTEKFSAKNCEVLALARNVQKLEQQFSKLENVQFAHFDLSENVRLQATQLFENFGQFDLLINNAGLLINKPFLALSHDELQNAYQVNVIGVMETVQAAIPFLNENDAHIVNISTMGGFQGSMKFAGLSAYSTSKAALCSFTELFSEEFKESKIAMNCLCLGAVQTEMLKAAFPGYQAPLNSEQMATFISEFSLEAHKYLRGKIIPVSLSNP